MLHYTVEELKACGYQETAPGVFSRRKPLKKNTSKKNPWTHIQKPVAVYTIKGEKKEIHFRSTWEYVVAEYLNYLLKHKKIALWDYECQKFHFKQSDSNKAGHRAAYLPDFYVERLDETHTWVEVKGHLTKKAQAQLNRMAIEYPEEEVEIWTKDIVRSLKEAGFGKNPTYFSA